MQLGNNAHFVFKQHIRKKKMSDALTPGSFFAPVGGISYFVCGGEYETKIYIQNYFSLLTDSKDAKAKWTLDIYGTSGEKIETKEGRLTGSAGAVITLSDEKKYGKFGTLWTKIAFDDAEYTASKPFGTIFFAEFSKKTAAQSYKIIMHSLGFPTASIYDYDRTTTGLMMPADSSPHLIYANGSLLTGRGTSAGGTIDFINAKHQHLEVKIPEIALSLGSNKLDLFSISSALRAHIGGEPFSMQMKGHNILGKPLLIMEGKDTFKGDHL